MQWLTEAPRQRWKKWFGSQWASWTPSDLPSLNRYDVGYSGPLLGFWTILLQWPSCRHVAVFPSLAEDSCFSNCPQAYNGNIWYGRTATLVWITQIPSLQTYFGLAIPKVAVIPKLLQKVWFWSQHDGSVANIPPCKHRDPIWVPVSVLDALFPI